MTAPPETPTVDHDEHHALEAVADICRNGCAGMFADDECPLTEAMAADLESRGLLASDWMPPHPEYRGAAQGDGERKGYRLTVTGEAALEAGPTETPSLTTEQARATATGWAMLRDYDQRLAAFKAGEGGGFPLMAARPPGQQAIEQLFAWVRARVLAEGDPETYTDPAAHLARVVSADLCITEEQAEALLDAADGWPS